MQQVVSALQEEPVCFSLVTKPQGESGEGHVVLSFAGAAKDAGLSVWRAIVSVAEMAGKLPVFGSGQVAPRRARVQDDILRA